MQLRLTRFLCETQTAEEVRNLYLTSGFIEITIRWSPARVIQDVHKNIYIENYEHGDYTKV
jgi:hypothetical protein